LSSDFVRSILKSDGTVWSWGNGFLGTLGHGYATNSDTPVQALNLSGVVAFDQDYGAAVAVDQNGDIWFWGTSLCEPDPSGIGTNGLAPKKIANLRGAKSIALRLCVLYLLRSDGSVWMLRFGSYTPTVVEGLRKVAGVNDVVLLTKSLVVTAGGRIYDLAGNQFTQEGLGEVVAVSGDLARHVLALRKDSTVWAWGDNRLGQLGDGTFNDSQIPVRVTGISEVVQVSARYDYNLALTKDGSVWFWGYEGKQDDQLIGRSIPVKIEGLHSAVSVCTYAYCLVMKQDNTYWGFSVGDKTPSQILFAY
jgi:alpha-tubulin suppressor-like RCC1 family protein